MAALLAGGMTLALAGCGTGDGMRAAGKPYHHLADGTFRNPPGSPARAAGLEDFVPFMMRRVAARADAVAVPPGHVTPVETALADLEEMAGRDSITWLGHAAFLIRMADLWILTDPYLGETAGPAGFGPRRYVPPGIPFERLPPIDVLVVSHNHYDHLDAPTIEALPGKERMLVIAPLRLGDFFRQRGYRQVVDLDWYQAHAIGGLTVTCLPAVHFSRRGAFDRNRTLWASFAFDDVATRLWFSGDTAYGEVFGEIGRRAGPFDMALIGIGAYEPQAIMKATHATPEEAVRIADDIGAARTVGMHWGTVVLTDEPPFEPPERFRAAAAAAGWTPERAILMRIGETLPLPGPGN
jgi:L-ascorbate metabolism protein UlaG (beta-lactamase superfamily)